MKVKPFEPQKDRYTVVDNVIFDRIMPSLSPNAWKVLCLILRKTRGWHKEWDGLSYSQIMEGTGIKSSATVRQALVELLDKSCPCIKQTKAGDKWTAAKYCLNTALEIEVENGAALEIKVEPALESKDTKQRSKTKRKQREGETPARDYLTDVLEHQQNNNHAGVADPSSDPERWLQYRDQALAAYRELTSLYPDNAVGKPAISDLAAEPDFDMARWRQAISTCRLGGVRPGNIACMIDAYRAGGDYSKMHQPIGPRRGKGNGHAPNHNSGRIHGRVPKYSVADPAGWHDSHDGPPSKPPDDATG